MALVLGPGEGLFVWQNHPLNHSWGTFLAVQWLRLHASRAGGLGSAPGRGTRSHMPQLGVHTPQLRTLQATRKTEYPACCVYDPVRPNKYIFQSIALGAGDCQTGNKIFSNSIIRVIGILSLSLLLELCCVWSITQLCPTLCDPLTAPRQAPLSMGFSRQEYWSGLPCPPPGNLPKPGSGTCGSYVSCTGGSSLPLALPGEPLARGNQ